MGATEARREFEELLCDLFNEPAIRRWLRLGPDGDEVSALLPGPPLALRELVHAATDVLLRKGLLELRWFERLMQEFPRRESDIRRVLGRWIDARPEGAPCPAPAVHHPEQRRLSDALEHAYQRRESAVVAGEGLGSIDREILELRRALRQGPQLKPGECLDHGRYRLIESIGAGGYASVWRAYDRERRQLVAMKVLHGQWTGERSRRERFERGARNMARLHHPNVVPILRGVFEEEGYLAYAMELAAGGDLRQRVLIGGLDDARCIELVLELCDALEHAHACGIVHRDIKPSNVLLTAADVPLLTDFDLVKALDTTGGTGTGVGLGTFLYAAPELMSQAGEADARSDVYSLGMTLLFCLARRELDLSVLVDSPSWLRSLACSDMYKDVLQGAIAHRPERRFASIAELRAALDGAGTGPVAIASRLDRALAETAIEECSPRIALYLESNTWERETYEVTGDGRTVELARHDLCRQQVGAVVCGVDRSGDGGQAFASLREFGGAEVYQQLAGLPLLRAGEVLALDAGRLPARHIFCAVQDPAQVRLDALEASLSALVLACVRCADELRMSSIALPMLFSGALGLPAGRCLEGIFIAAAHALGRASALRRIVIVVHDAGRALRRAGGAITVDLPATRGRRERQRFCLADHPSARHLRATIWSEMLKYMDVPSLSYGRAWQLRDLATGSLLALDRGAPQAHPTLASAGFTPGARLEAVLTTW
jgi:O-acetyl-ADP-ribose deacetylase (regulator of RNase III)